MKRPDDPLATNSLSAPDPTLSNRIFLVAVTMGITLRLVAALAGDVGVYVDSTLRIEIAMRWATQPSWQGLTAVWPWFHMYVLGLLIKIWNQPILIAKTIGFVCGISSLFVFRKAVSNRFGREVGSLCALMLAVYWTHIWLGSSYWVETPYLLLVLTAVHFAEKLVASRRLSYAPLIGICLTVALLLRHEALLLMLLFGIWVLWQTRSLKAFLAFAVLPAALASWYFIERLPESSYFDYFRLIDQSKEMEAVVDLVSRRTALLQWGLMLGASPTFLVVLPGIYGLWKRRRDALRDLFAWMFVTQFVFHFGLTLDSGWRPQLRYLLLIFVNLFPYAAVVWLDLIRRFSPKYVLTLMLAFMIVIQSVGWWIGRNNRLPGGWLPVMVNTPSQQTLDVFIKQLRARKEHWLRIRSIVPGPRSDRWSLSHSFVINRMHPDELDLAEVDAHVDGGLTKGVLPPVLIDSDVILIDPEAPYYPAVMAALNDQRPNLVKKSLHPRLTVILFSDAARAELADI